MDYGIAGKRVLVCAASKGLGFSIARLLLLEGADLFLCARGADTLEAAAGKLTDLQREQGLSNKLAWMPCDLTDRYDRIALADRIQQEWGGLDILVHNVGGPESSSVQATTLEQWEAGFQRLFLSVAHLNQVFLPGMKEQGWGRIVIITSGSVMEPIPNLAVSNAMRSAVTSMAKTLASEVADTGVTVNCVAPGIIYTDRIEERINQSVALEGGDRESKLQQYVTAIPAGRMGTPEEFAQAVAFLCSQGASYITGTTLSVDGGKRKAMF